MFFHPVVTLPIQEMQILQLGPKRYVLTDVICTGQANLQVHSQGRLGQPDTMFPVTHAIAFTKSLNLDQAKLLYSLLQNKAPLTEQEWKWILPQQHRRIENLLN